MEAQERIDRMEAKLGGTETLQKAIGVGTLIAVVALGVRSYQQDEAAEKMQTQLERQRAAIETAQQANARQDTALSKLDEITALSMQNEEILINLLRDDIKRRLRPGPPPPGR